MQLLVKTVRTKVSSYAAAHGKAISLWYGFPCAWIHQLCHPAKKQPSSSAASHLCPIIHAYEVNIYFINVSLVLLPHNLRMHGRDERGVWREWCTVFMQLQFQLPTLKLRIPYTIRTIDVKNNEFYKCKVDPCLIRRHVIKTYGDQEEVYLHSLLNGEWPSSRAGRVNTPSSERTDPCTNRPGGWMDLDNWFGRSGKEKRQPIFLLTRGFCRDVNKNSCHTSPQSIERLLFVMWKHVFSVRQEVRFEILYVRISGFKKLKLLSNILAPPC